MHLIDYAVLFVIFMLVILAVYIKNTHKSKCCGCGNKSCCNKNRINI